MRVTINYINKQRTISGKVTSAAYLSTFSIRRYINKKSATNVKILNKVNNPQVTNVPSIQVGTSETIRSLSENSYEWFNWLAGLIDGDGYFAFSKKGYASLEIIMDMKDAKCLYQIKQYLGGSVKRRSGVKALRYRLHNYKGLIFLIENINGRIRNPIRQIQLSKICENYKIEFKFPLVLEKENGWLAGFFDSDGTVTINRANMQLSISIFQKSSELLIPLKNLYGGYVYIDRSLNGGFKWYITSKADILNIIEYFKKYSSRAPSKNARLHLIPNYYYIKSLDLEKNEKDKLWDHFFKKWFSTQEILTISDKDIVH